MALVKVSTPIISTITQNIKLSREKIDIDFYEFCYLLIKENRLKNEDTGIYSIEYFPKGANNKHQVLEHYPFGYPPSKIKRNKKKNKKNVGSFHNQCAFYCKLGENYFVHIMMFTHPNLKIVGLRNDDRDCFRVARRFIKEFNYIFGSRKLDTSGIRYFNTRTNTIETKTWINCLTPKFEVCTDTATCYMYNKTFNVNYTLDQDCMIDILRQVCKLNARKKDNYSGIVCTANYAKWVAPSAVMSDRLIVKYSGDFKLSHNVNLFIFSTGKIIMIYKSPRDSDLIYDILQDILVEYQHCLSRKRTKSK